MPQTVAILGAGPSGIAAARWLTHCGFDCTLFEQGGAIGGQWNDVQGATSPYSVTPASGPGSSFYRAKQ